MELALKLVRPMYFPVSFRRTVATVVLCALVIAMNACTAVSSKQVAQDMLNAIPVIQASIDTAATVAVGIDPLLLPAVTAALAIATPAANQIKILLAQYVASTSPTILGSINDVVTSVLNSSAASLLDAAKITDPQSRATAIRLIGAIQTAYLLFYAIYQKIQTKAQVKATANARAYKLRDIAPYLDDGARQTVTARTGYSFHAALSYEMAQGF